MLKSHRDDQVGHRRHTSWLLGRASSWLSVRFRAVLINLIWSKIFHLVTAISYEIALTRSAILVQVLID